MRRILVPILAGGLLAASSVPTPALEVVDQLTFAPNGEKALRGDPGRVPELEIDQSVRVSWDREAFLRELANELQVAAPGDSLELEIKALRDLVREILVGQAHWTRVKSVTLRLIAEGKPVRDDEDFIAANDAYGSSTERWTTVAMAWTADWGDPRLEDLLNRVTQTEASEQVWADSVAAFLDLRLAEITDELEIRIAAGVEVGVQMEARLRSGALGTVPVHLEGYDNVQIGDPAPFERFQIAVDDRTRAELEAAENLGDMVESVVSGEFQAEVSAALRDLDRAAAELGKSLRVEVLQANLDELVNELEKAGTATADSILTEARLARDWVQGLADSPALEGESDIDRLVSLSRQLDGHVRALWQAATRLPETLDNLAIEVEAMVAARPDMIRDDLVATLRSSAEDFAAGHEKLMEFYRNARELAGALATSGDLAMAAADFTLTPRRIGDMESLDTFFDLQTVRDAERHPGDRLTLTVKVFRYGEDKRLLVQERQAFVLQAYGPYVEPRGALLFVDPRSSIERDLSFQPTVGLGIHVKSGIRGAGWWNDWLRPGIGVSFALLDFQDSSEFELGVAGSVTFLKDLFWSGYGRNLQAKADYFYLAINPLAIPVAW